jgi:hypothetical protein
MGWLSDGVLPALIGLVLILIVIYLFFGGLVRVVLMAGSTIFAVTDFGSNDGHRTHTLILLAAALVGMIAVSIYFSWGGGSTTWRARLLTFSLLAISLWIWIQSGAPWKLWVIGVGAVVFAIWGVLAWATPGARPRKVHVEAASVTQLLQWDAEVLQALYEATNGRKQIYVYLWQLQEYLDLSPGRVQIATERLVESGRVECSEDGNALALKRRGVEAVEQTHQGRKASSMGDTFHFHGNASGVFGSRNKVRDSTFTSSSESAEWVRAALVAADDLRSQVAPDTAAEVERIAEELRNAGDNTGLLRRAAKHAVTVATAIGEVGAPLLKAANEIIKALAG